MFRTAATRAEIEVRLLAAKPIHQRKRIPTESPRPHQRPGTQAKETAVLRRGPIRSTTSPVRPKWIAVRQKEPVSTVVKVDTWQMSAQRRKLKATIFAYLRKAQTAANVNMSGIQTAQRSEMEAALSEPTRLQ